MDQVYSEPVPDPSHIEPPEGAVQELAAPDFGDAQQQPVGAPDYGGDAQEPPAGAPDYDGDAQEPPAGAPNYDGDAQEPPAGAPDDGGDAEQQPAAAEPFVETLMFAAWRLCEWDWPPKEAQ
jgi:hypothetical protein